MPSNQPAPTLENLSLLGQGLNSILPVSDLKGGLLEVPIKDITRWEDQPRTYFSSDALEQLANSIRRNGIEYPLIVRPKEDKYELIAGDRRYQAALLAKLEQVPVLIQHLCDEQALELSLEENLSREDLNPVEILNGILRLLSSRLEKPIDEIPDYLRQLRYQWDICEDKEQREIDLPSPDDPLQLTVYETFKQYGYHWYTYTCNQLKLWDLPPCLFEAISKGRLEYSKGLRLKVIKNPDVLSEWVERTISEQWSLSTLRENLRIFQQEEKAKKPDDVSPQQKLETLHSRLKKIKPWKKHPKVWKQIQRNLNAIEIKLGELEENRLQ